MTEREKLIELCKEAHISYLNDEHAPAEYSPYLADHLLANGVVVPPASVGQVIWYLRVWLDGSCEIAEGKISKIQQKSDKTRKIRISAKSSVWDFTPNEIGKWYFLTKEEAEAKLKEVQG